MPAKKKAPKVLRKDLIDRKILFYRVNPGGKPGAEPVLFDPTNSLKAIAGLDFTEDGRYQVDSTGDAFVCWPESFKAPWKFVFGKTRRYNLPQQESGGSRKALSMPVNAGLCEVSHMVWFPENILGVERNFYSGTPANLHSYLQKKADGIYTCAGFELLIKKQAFEELQKLEEIRLFHVKVQRSYVDLLATADTHLAGLLQTQMDAVAADEIEIILRVARRTKHGLLESLRSNLGKLAKVQDLPEKLETLTAKGPAADTGRMQEVDFLSDELVVTKSMLRVDPRSRAVQATSAFLEIEKAYKEVQSVLATAAAIQP